MSDRAKRATRRNRTRTRNQPPAAATSRRRTRARARSEPPPTPPPPPPRNVRRRARALTPPAPQPTRCTRRTIKKQEKTGGSKIGRFDCKLGDGVPLDDVIFDKESKYYMDLRGKHIIYAVSNNVPNDKDRVKVGKSTDGFARLKSYTFSYGRSCDKDTCDLQDIRRTGGVNLLFLAIVPKKYVGAYPPRPFVNVIETNLLRELRSKKINEKYNIFQVNTRGGEIFESEEGRLQIVKAVKGLMDTKEVTETLQDGRKLEAYDDRSSQRARDSSCRLALRNIARYCDAGNIFREYTDRLKEDLFEDISETLDLSPDQKKQLKAERKELLKELRGKQRRIDMKGVVEEQKTIDTLINRSLTLSEKT